MLLSILILILFICLFVFFQVGGVANANVVHQTAAAAVGAAAAAVAAAGAATQGTGQFQRLKVEDALSYLDQV